MNQQSKKKKEEKKQPKMKFKSSVKRNNNSISINGKDNWDDSNTDQERSLLDDRTIFTYFNIIINQSGRSDVVFIDSLLTESNIKRRNVKRIVVGNNRICLGFVYIRKETPESSHWLLIIIDKSFDHVEVYVIDSFNCYFNHSRTKNVITTIIDAFKETENGDKQVNINYVRIINQKTNWECGYRVIKIAKMFIENDFDINCLSKFDYADFMNNFVPQIAENKIELE